MKHFIFGTLIAFMAAQAPMPALAQADGSGMESTPVAESRPAYTLRFHQETGPSALYYASGIAATILFCVAGFQMSGIKSIAGNSTAEAFYQAMGTASFGMAGFTVMQLALPSMQPQLRGAEVIEEK